MKVLMILLPALVQLTVSGTAVGSDMDGVKQMVACNSLRISVSDLTGQVSSETGRSVILLVENGLFNGSTPADDCAQNATIKYMEDYKKEINFKNCRKIESLENDSSDCIRRILLRLDCYLKIAKLDAKHVHKQLDEMSKCSSLGYSKFVQEVITQISRKGLPAETKELMMIMLQANHSYTRSRFEFNHTIIDEMEELKRKYSGQSLSL